MLNCRQIFHNHLSLRGFYLLRSDFCDRTLTTADFHASSSRCRRKKDEKSVNKKSPIRSLPNHQSELEKLQALFKPVVVFTNPDDINFGEEIAGKLNKTALLKQLNLFYSSKEVKILAKEHGLDGYLYNQAYSSFRRFCVDTKHLPTELHVLFSDILQGAVHNHDLFPYFLTHAKKVFPHLDCMDELKLISDLTNPPNWYPEARGMTRKIIFHGGPTNSGKTYHALERFLTAKSGIYCGPLKLLAVEVYNKSNAREVPCDLVTGEERKMCNEEGEPSSHVACTVEMSNLAQHYEVAVIDEIQVIKDYQRGWAWTRALLGLQADEIHVCGEQAAIDLVREIMISTGEEVEVRNYKRLTELLVEDKALGSLANAQDGDCIVCFNKNDIYNVSRQLEKLGKEAAVIYGSLPANTKLAMAAKFNDPEDPCKILVATDAVGMGLNLNIRRMIFYSIHKIQLLENGEKAVDLISVSQSLQIAGRAGRFGTKWETGYVTTFKTEDHQPLKDLLGKTPEEILQAGLHPTFDQLELYAYHLPAASLSNLVDIFISLSTLDDSLYTLCHLDDFKFLADMIEHIRLPLKAKYTFCCAPINRKMPFVTTMFLKMARQFSRGDLISFDWLCTQVGWPFSPPDTILDLIHLESIHDVFDIYLWLSYRFPDMFPDIGIVREVQLELDSVIEAGVNNLVQLLKNNENEISGRTLQLDEDLLEPKSQHQASVKNSLLRNLKNKVKSKGFSVLKELAETTDFESERLEGNRSSNKYHQTIESAETKDSPGYSKKTDQVPKEKIGLLDKLVKDGVITPRMAKKLIKEAQDSLVSKKELPDTTTDIAESERLSVNRLSNENPQTIDSFETKDFHDDGTRIYLGSLSLKHNFPENSRLFVSGCGDATEDEIKARFANFGDIEYVEVMRKKPLAFVKFAKTSDAAKALVELNGLPLGSEQQPIKVEIAKPKDKFKLFNLNSPWYSRLLVSGCGDATQDEIKAHFANFGDVEFVDVIRDRDTNQPREMAFVKFAKTSDAAKALEELNGQLLGSEQRPIKVEIATPIGSDRFELPPISTNCTRIIITCPKTTRIDELTEVFGHWGKVDRAVMIFDRKTEAKTGQAIIIYHKFSHAALAVEECDKSYKASFISQQTQKRKQERKKDIIR